MKKIDLRKIDYRYYICFGLTLLSILLLIFAFPYAFIRLGESFRDFGLSVAYYFCEILEINHEITPKVTSFSNCPLSMPFGLPDTWEQFVFLWDKYWHLWGDKGNFDGYINKLGNDLYVVSKVLLLGVPLIVLFVLLGDKYFNNINNDYNKDSKALTFYKKHIENNYSKIKLWVKEFIQFFLSKEFFCKLCLIIWLLNFNVISIFVEFLAYYFYFVVSFDFLTLYVQIYKLLCDLSPMLDFLPVIVWVILGYVIFHTVRKNIGYKTMNHYEMRNRGFINSLPICTMVVGKMGDGKTKLITDMAISQEVMFRDKAFEMLLEQDLKFPHFPWINFENVLKKAIKKRIIYNLATTKVFIDYLRSQFEFGKLHPEAKRLCRKHLKKKFSFIRYSNMLFDYNYERYGYTYDDKHKVICIWDTLKIYAQLYFIYVIQSSLLISNYSIRVDSVLDDVGNFPIWNHDFFRRDSRLLTAYSRHSHILDFDMLRLGKKVIEDNKNANAFEFGVIVVTEIGKERGNNLELLDKKKKEEVANQKNDLFTYTLKLIRHMGTVDNYPFVKVFTDDQRAQSWGANDRDTCNVVTIIDKGEPSLTMPFFDLEDMFICWLHDKFRGAYYRYRHNRADNTLPMYLFKVLFSKCYHFYSGIRNTFGFNKTMLTVEDGKLDGEKNLCKYYSMAIKIFRERFSTDCFSDLFVEKSLRSDVGIGDLREYFGKKATFEELMYQNSYFMMDLFDKFDVEETTTKE